MAFTAKQLSVTGDAEAVLVFANAATSKSDTLARETVVTVANGSGNTVYIGGSDATTDGTNGTGASAANAGIPVDDGVTKDFVLSPGDELYVFAHTTSVINVAANGQ